MKLTTYCVLRASSHEVSSPKSHSSKTTQLMSCVHEPNSRFENKDLDAKVPLLHIEFEVMIVE